ncbi:hypothetical protein F5X68DRAFT_34172 [Plectosphaerella plurivora]|uniref:Uncharacterized protein n=1 Tax=Plectosphaerella plurivora TaxID=936078 RepID=A0A9P8V5N2_9PEZI|nr:hypothetical protein F5X68DRAFT_34172 [Plectosphaerella plurivora]
MRRGDFDHGGWTCGGIMPVLCFDLVNGSMFIHCTQTWAVSTGLRVCTRCPKPWKPLSQLFRRLPRSFQQLPSPWPGPRSRPTPGPVRLVCRPAVSYTSYVQMLGNCHARFQRLGSRYCGSSKPGVYGSWISWGSMAISSPLPPAPLDTPIHPCFSRAPRAEAIVDHQIFRATIHQCACERRQHQLEAAVQEWSGNNRPYSDL